MHSQKFQPSNSIRFRRWSRAGYAVFCSLACCVTIGCVAISISDKSLQKASGMSFSEFYVTDSSASEDTERENLETALQQIQETTLVQTIADIAAATGQSSSYIFIHHSG